MRYFLQIWREFPTARHLVFWKPYPWVKILKNILNASLENLSTTNYTKPLFRITWHFWTNTKYSGEVSLIIFMDIFIGSWLSVWELYLIVKHIEISLYAQTQQSLLFLTQGNMSQAHFYLIHFLKVRHFPGKIDNKPLSGVFLEAFFLLQ